jgi:alpha-tubulin suppressor-like RCC1 family protein
MQRTLQGAVPALLAAGLIACGGGQDQTNPQAPVASVLVSPGELTLGVGASRQLTASAYDEDGNALAGRLFTWRSSEPAVTAVTDAGLVSGVGPGSATITATSEGKSGTATIAVSVPVASVTVTPAELALEVGESQQLTATPRDQDGNALEGREIAWTATEPAVAGVSASGLVTGEGDGTTIITASSEGKTGTASVSVTAASLEPVASVTVAPGELTFVKGGSQQLAAVLQDQAGNPLAGRSVSWTTSDPAVATVSSTGLVSGDEVGSATITATSEGKSGSATVSITVVTFIAAATGGAHTCAITTQGATYCWGRGESGQLGIPVPAATCVTDAGPFPCSDAPVAVQGEITFTHLTGGGAHTCGLTSDGSAYCWGSNVLGQLGDNSTTNRDTPVAVATSLRFVSIDAGAEHTCGLTSNGKAYCWGRNDKGQLGDGTTTARSAPEAVTGNHTFQAIVAGGFNIGHTCALTNSGDTYCWGSNERGQLGNGSGGLGAEDLTPYPVPAQVSGAPTFVSLTVGLGRHTCGLTSAGDAYCWGENSFGALGDGSTTDRTTPVPVSGGIEFSLVIAGGFIGHTCALASGGAAYCWGENSVGQVGDKSTDDRLEPAHVSGHHSFTTLDAGFRHTCGLASDVLYCWGSGGAGQLGNGSDLPESAPRKVVGQP